MKQEWVTDTRKVVKVGQDSLAINIRKDLAEVMGVAVGSLIEVKMKNTGRRLDPLVKEIVKPNPIIEPKNQPIVLTSEEEDFLKTYKANPSDAYKNLIKKKAEDQLGIQKVRYLINTYC